MDFNNMNGQYGSNRNNNDYDDGYNGDRNSNFSPRNNIFKNISFSKVDIICLVSLAIFLLIAILNWTSFIKWWFFSIAFPIIQSFFVILIVALIGFYIYSRIKRRRRRY